MTRAVQSMILLWLTVLCSSYLVTGYAWTSPRTSELVATVTITETRVITVTSYSATVCTSGIKPQETPKPISGVQISKTSIILLVVLCVVLLLFMMCGTAWVICFVKMKRSRSNMEGDCDADTD